MPDFQVFAGNSIQIYAQEDETIALPGASNPIDTLDYENDILSITAEVTYCIFNGSVCIGPTMTVTSPVVTLTIIDTDTPPPSRTVALATSDGSAKEPHSVYYLPSATEDNGEATFTFTNWLGGTVGLALGGNATLGSDYLLSLGVAPAGTTLTGLNLFVPAGATSVKLLVRPLDDLIETDSGETVSIAIASVPAGVTSSGTANVTIADAPETLKIVATPADSLEYRVDPVFADFQITPVDGTAKMKGLVFLEIDASAMDAAIPIDDYSLEGQRPSPFPIPIYPVTPGSKLYRTDPFSINDLDFQLVRVKPVNDRILEQDEKIKATLKSFPRYTLPSPDPGIFGDATITIKDNYLDSETKADPGACSCCCSCAGDVSIDKRDADVTITSLGNANTRFRSEGQDSQSPILLIGLTLPAGKAVPTFIDITVHAVTPNFDTSGNPIGLGRTVGNGVFQSVTIAIPTGSTVFNETSGERKIWFVVQADLTSDNFAPGTSIGGIDYSIPNVQTLVPDTAPGASAGRVKREMGTAIIYANGTTEWFKNGNVAPPQSLSSLSAGTLKHRDNSKRQFGASGRMTQAIDPQGNITNIQYDTFGRITKIIDPLSEEKTFTYFEGGTDAAPTPATTAQANRVRVQSPDSQVTLMTYDRVAKVLKFTHTDPDGAGSRLSLGEDWAYGPVGVTSLARGARTATGTLSGIRTTTIDYNFNASATNDSRGDRRAATVTDANGGTTSVIAALNEKVIVATGLPRELDLVAFPGLGGTKTFLNEAVVTDSRQGRSLFRLAPGGHVSAVLDPVQYERLYGTGLPPSTRTPQQLALQEQLSSTYSIADPTRDVYGNSTGQYLSLPTASLSPDPDLIVSGTTTLSNGPRGRQTTALTYTNGNLTSYTPPTLPAQATQFNETFDIPTRSFDEFGNPSTQTVDGNGLVTRQRTLQNASAWTNPVDRYDVNNGGTVAPIDGQTIINFLSAQGVSSYVIAPDQPLQSGRYYDVNGSGTVTSADALEVINEISRRNSNGGVNTFPTTVADRTLTYTAAGLGLPRGLVTQERIATGRTGAASEIITDYEYVNTTNTPGATPQQRAKLLRMTVAPATTEEAITDFVYDTRGNLILIADPFGRISKFFYDSLNRITATLGPDPDAAGPLLGLATRFDYDVFNNVIATETINSYLDVPANKVLVTGTKTFTIYNGIDLPTNQFQQNPSVTWYLNPSGASVLQTNVKATATAAAVMTNAQLDAYLSGNSVVINTPNIVVNQGLVTTIAYNAAGDLLTVTQTPAGTPAAARTTTFAYDKLGRQTRVTTPLEISVKKPIHC